MTEVAEKVDSSKAGRPGSEAGLVVLRARRLPYHEAWELQRRLHAQRVVDERPDTVVLLEHDPVYTAGRGTQPTDVPAGDLGAPLVEVDRGGRVPWHGPGQLTGYPIVALRRLRAREGGAIDLVSHIRRLEEVLIQRRPEPSASLAARESGCVATGCRTPRWPPSAYSSFAA